MKSTQAMRDRIRELMSREQDDYDRAVECVLDDLEGILASAQAPAYPDTELLPCPFCGKPGALCDLEDEPGSPASFWVNCSCGVETPERRTEAEAITLWNTRTGALAQGARNPEVVAAVQQALMKHPGWETCVGSSAFVFAFGLANTAIDAYTSALSSTEPRCTCAAIVNPNIPHARFCPLSSTSRDSASTYCALCDHEHQLHEDAQGFHHVVKGARVACPFPTESK